MHSVGETGSSGVSVDGAGRGGSVAPGKAGRGRPVRSGAGEVHASITTCRGGKAVTNSLWSVRRFCSTELTEWAIAFVDVSRLDMPQRSGG